MYPGLSHGAYEALHAHGTPETEGRPTCPSSPAASGTGTMCLTEPHCGTDLGLLRTKAEPVVGAPEGTYRLTGQKIFISAGEHDLAANIIHLVLAPPARCAGRQQGDLAVRRAQVRCRRRWLDWRAQSDLLRRARTQRWASTATPPRSSTSTAPSARWWAQPHKGPWRRCFVMMNARPAWAWATSRWGLTEVGLPETRAAYAKDRIQMRSLSGPKSPDKPADPIIVHPDVRKMLLTARAYAEGGRALAIHIAMLIEKELYSDDARRAQGLRRRGGAADADRQGFSHRQRLDRHVRTASRSFGGHGYIKEWGMEQFVRDARINMIYEGTNTIQSLDLLGAQGAGRQRRQAAQVRPEGAGLHRGTKA